MTKLELNVASLTDVGQAREQNEDALFAGTHVFAVADGLGGHLAGEVASNLALESIAPLDKLEPKRAAAQIGDAVRRANRAVYEHAEREDKLKGMGTTMTVVAIDGGTANLGHVGDSRCYLIRGGRISQISTDHTLVNRMVSEGKLTVEQAEVHPQRSIITRALGADRDVDVEEISFDIGPGDLVLLCSDGLSGVMPDDDILAAVNDAVIPSEICRALIDAANARGGPDNITVVAIEIGGVGAPPSARAKKTPKRFPMRTIVWSSVVLVVVIAAVVGVRVWQNRSWYVGIDGARVGIYHGLPVSFAGMHLSSIAEPTAIETNRIPPGMRARLEDGIRARTLQDARRIVAEQIEPNAKPTTSAKPSPSPTSRAKASP